MWQAISHLLREQLGEGEIELRNELPGGEIHAAWHLRYAGRDLFVKCDERELLPIFTAEADQLELLSRSKTVTVPQVLAVGGHDTLGRAGRAGGEEDVGEVVRPHRGHAGVL